VEQHQGNTFVGRTPAVGRRAGGNEHGWFQLLCRFT
jgi:hypothetical protein